ncbi:MAG: MarC family protein [Calditrichia bacterium]
MNWSMLTNFAVAIFAIINPIGKIPIWAELTGDQKRPVRIRIAVLTTVTSLGILLPFLLFGKQILHFFEMDLASFQIAGGLLVLLTAIQMVQGQATRLEQEDEDGDSDYEIAKKRFRRILVPLAVPMTAGPGTITTVMIYSLKATEVSEYLGLGVILGITALLVFLVFILGTYIEDKIDDLIYSVVTRLFGLILAGIAIQLMVEGLGQVFPAWLNTNSVIENEIQSMQ